MLKRVLLTALLLFCWASTDAYSQVTLSISKTHNAPNPIPSGQAFTYTITYSWSGGAPGTLYIIDNVPSTLDVISALPGNPVSVITGNQVVFTLTGLSLPSGSGTVQINAKFKPGVTCAGERACNRAGISTNMNANFVYSNESCVTAATPTNKWQFEKEWIAGCAINDEVIFRIKVINPSGSDIGGLNLTNVSLSDFVPANSVVTAVYGSWTGISGTTLTGGPSTLTVSPWNAWYTAYIKVQFPSGFFTAGQQVINQANMSFNTPCNSQMTTWTDTAKVTLCQGVSSGALNKYLTLSLSFPNNPSWYPVFSPGCCGSYHLNYVNNGTLAQPNFVMEDLIPPQLDVNKIYTNVTASNTPVTVDVYCWTGTNCSSTPCTTVVYNSAGWQTLTGLPPNVCKVRWSYSGSIAVSQGIYNYMDVCVRSNNYTNGAPVLTGQNVVNTVNVSATNLSTLTATHTKVIDAVAPKVVTTKLLIGDCNNACQVNPSGPFQPGDTVRFRMAVANIGNANATLCSINDILPAGLTYVGNETYFYGGFNWMANIYNPPCCSLTVSVPSQVGGAITSPAVGATNLTWTFPVLPSRCDGTVEYFLIDFDVKISDNPPAPPGQYTNTFNFAASNVSNILSNPAILTVNATAQLQAIKEVRKQGSTNPWSFSASVLPGAMAEYRVRVVNSGNTQLTNLCLLDIMPWVGDIKVLPPYTSRGSGFDLPYNPANGAFTITPAGFTPTYNSLGLIQTKNPTRSTECGGFCGVSDPVGAIAGSYIGAATQTYSFKISANPSVNLMPGASLDAIIPVKLPQGLQTNLNACNSFAIQAVPLGMPNVCLKAESNNACISVAEEIPCLKIGERKITCVGQNQNGQWIYQLQFNITNLSGQNGLFSISPSVGTIQSYTPNNLPNGVPTTVNAVYLSSSNNAIVCFNIVLYDQKENKLCDTTFCLDLLPCPDPCPCPFKMIIEKPQSSQSSGNQVFVGGVFTVSGTNIMKVKATVVSATITQTCKNGSSTTYTPSTSIVWTNLNPLLTTGIGTNEIIWTNLNCPPLQAKNLNMYLNIPNSPPKGCVQSVKFCIRYTFTDCKCNTCDTLVCYEIIRKWTPIKIDHDWSKVIGKGTDIIQSEDSPFALIAMESQTKGKLYINNPAEDEYTAGITLTSVKLSAGVGVGLSSLKPNSSSWSEGIIDGNGMKSSGVLAPGSNLVFDLEFNNSAEFRTWINKLELDYLIGSIQDTMKGELDIKSKVPGTIGGDILSSSGDDMLELAKTYAIVFENANKGKDSISTVTLRAKSGKIIATGPNSSSQEIKLKAFKLDDGTYNLMSDASDEGKNLIFPIPSGVSVFPIYVTIIPEDNNSILIDYSTFNTDNEAVSMGTLEIKQEITSVVPGKSDVSIIKLLSAIPNPATNSTLIRFTLYNDEPKIKLSVVDELGREIDNIYDSKPMNAGMHDFIFDTSKLMNGLYFIHLSNGKVTQTQKLIIKK